MKRQKKTCAPVGAGLSRSPSGVTACITRHASANVVQLKCVPPFLSQMLQPSAFTVNADVSVSSSKPIGSSSRHCQGIPKLSGSRDFPRQLGSSFSRKTSYRMQPLRPERGSIFKGWQRVGGKPHNINSMR